MECVSCGYAKLRASDGSCPACYSKIQRTGSALQAFHVAVRERPRFRARVAGAVDVTLGILGLLALCFAFLESVAQAGVWSLLFWWWGFPFVMLGVGASGSLVWAGIGLMRARRGGAVGGIVLGLVITAGSLGAAAWFQGGRLEWTLGSIGAAIGTSIASMNLAMWWALAPVSQKTLK